MRPIRNVHLHLAILLTLLSKATYNYIHTFTHRRRSQPHRATTSSSAAVRVRCLAQAHLDNQLGGAADRTSNLLQVNPLHFMSHFSPSPVIVWRHSGSGSRGKCFTTLWGAHVHTGLDLLLRLIHCKRPQCQTLKSATVICREMSI